MLSSKLLEDDVGCVAGHSLVRPWSCVLASAKRYGLLSSLATIPLWPNAVNFVMNVVDFVYWRMGPHGSSWWLPMVSETGSDMPQRLLWVVGLITTGLGTCFSCFVYAELVVSQLVRLGSEHEVLRLHRQIACWTQLVALGLTLLGCFHWHNAGVDQLEWNSIHACCALLALLALHPHAKAARDLYDLALARDVPFMQDAALVTVIRVRRYMAHVMAMVGVIGALIMLFLPRPHPDRLPFDPRTHPVAFCEYVWILTMYVHFGTFVVDCRAAAKTWVPPDGTIFLQHGDPVKVESSLHRSVVFLQRLSVNLSLVCLLCWWMPFMCILTIVIFYCPPGWAGNGELCW
mmetsp:Transcript_12/g.36  ORF Transcript_12/g.36 Transcript_12/m.36 type:complete len:346 (+) Transcript_12:175-1212(+)